MTCHQRAEARFECSDYQLAAQVQQRGEMIGNAGRLQLRQKPEPLLGIGKRRRPLLFRSPDRLERLLLVQKGQDLGFVCSQLAAQFRCQHTRRRAHIEPSLLEPEFDIVGGKLGKQIFHSSILSRSA